MEHDYVGLKIDIAKLAHAFDPKYSSNQAMHASQFVLRYDHDTTSTIIPSIDINDSNELIAWIVVSGFVTIDLSPLGK